MNAPTQHQSTVRTLLVIAGVLLFMLAYALVNDLYTRWVSPYLTGISDVTLQQIVARLHVIIPALMVVVWRLPLFGFQIGKLRQHWRLVLVALIFNVAIVGAYLLLTGATPYSDDRLLINQIVTVPVVEEVVWRGIVLTVLWMILRRFRSERASMLLAVWLSGISFGVLHMVNALYGVPLAFVLVQALNACVWGVVYGYVRAKTESIYPPIFLHAVMNLLPILA